MPSHRSPRPDQAEGASGLIVAAFQIAIAGGAVIGGVLVDHLGVVTLLAELLVFAFGRRETAAASSRTPRFG